MRILVFSLLSFNTIFQLYAECLEVGLHVPEDVHLCSCRTYFDYIYRVHRRRIYHCKYDGLLNPTSRTWDTTLIRKARHTEGAVHGYRNAGNYGRLLRREIAEDSDRRLSRSWRRPRMIQHPPLSQSLPAGDYAFISCRNVVPYGG